MGFLEEMKYDLLSLGSAVIDKIVCVNDEFLLKNRLEKGGTRNYLNQDLEILIKQLENKTLLPVPGGSAANATKVVAGLGKKCAYIAKIGKDKWGEFYRTNCLERGIEPLFSESKLLPTGALLALVTPDGERTHCPDLRACQSITASDINANHFKHTNLFHLDGYNFYYLEALSAAIEAAKFHQCKISLDCGSYEIMRSHFEMIMELLEKRTFHLFFANEREAFELIGRSDPFDACHDLSKYNDYTTVMMGERGSVTYFQNKMYYRPTEPIKPVDTTGAGDMYVGGFLYGYICGASIEECMSYGTMTAAEGIQVFGGELPVKHLQQLQKKLTSLELVNS